MPVAGPTAVASGRSADLRSRESTVDGLVDGRLGSGIAGSPYEYLEGGTGTRDSPMVETSRRQDAVKREWFASVQDAKVVTFGERGDCCQALLHRSGWFETADIDHMLHGLLDVSHLVDNGGSVRVECSVRHGVEDLLFLHVVLLSEDH